MTYMRKPYSPIHFTRNYGVEGPLCAERLRHPGDIWLVAVDDWRRVSCTNCRSAWPLRYSQRWSTHADRWGLPRRMRRWVEYHRRSENYYDGVIGFVLQWVNRFTIVECGRDGEWISSSEHERRRQSDGSKVA